MITKTELRHCLGIEHIPTVKHDRRGHLFFHNGKIDIGELAPLRRDHERFRAFDCVERR